MIISSRSSFFLVLLVLGREVILVGAVTGNMASTKCISLALLGILVLGAGIVVRTVVFGNEAAAERLALAPVTGLSGVFDFRTSVAVGAIVLGNEATTQESIFALDAFLRTIFVVGFGIGRGGQISAASPSSLARTSSATAASRLQPQLLGILNKAPTFYTHNI
jgi:hypothetical protein